jgi:large subunit ribosomal protein L5
MSLKKNYNTKVVPEMRAYFSLKIEKVIVNIGIGKFLKESAVVDEIRSSITNITGQRPMMTKSKKSIAGFKIREGLEVGMKVTLRGRRMWHFLDRFVEAALPRVRDFRGIPVSSVDDSGNCNIGIREHLIFPEISPEQVKHIFSFQVTVATNAKNQEKGLALFRALGFPIVRSE